MKLLMISGDRSLSAGKKGPFFSTLEELSKHFERIDVLTPKVAQAHASIDLSNVFVHASPVGLLGQPHWIAEKGGALIAEHKHSFMTVHEFPPFYNGRGARMLHQLTNIPYALEVHHIVGHPVPANFAERIGHFLTTKYIARDSRSAKKVRVVNTEVRALLIRYGVDAKKMECVPSFYLDESILMPDLAIQKEHDLVFCGRLVANKGLPYLIQAVKQLPHVKLLIIGDGPEKARLTKQIEKLGISGRVQFAGWLPTQAAVFSKMQSAKMFVMNSLSEGGPRVALEAMALSMPVLATPVGVMPDVIENKVSGMFTTGKPNDLLEKIGVLLGDAALRDKIAGNARQAVLPRFERTRAIKAYADFLKSLA